MAQDLIKSTSERPIIRPLAKGTLLPSKCSRSAVDHSVYLALELLQERSSAGVAASRHRLVWSSRLVVRTFPSFEKYFVVQEQYRSIFFFFSLFLAIFFLISCKLQVKLNLEIVEDRVV
jgi:hypothetical protein